MSEHHNRWRRGVPVAALALTTVAGLVGTTVTATSAAADPLGTQGSAKGAPAAAPANPDAGCTLSPSLTSKSDRASCIGVGATLSSLPAVGQTATLTVTVETGRAETGTEVTVDLPATLAFADGTASAAAVNGAGATQRATLATVDLAKGETRTYTRTVKAVKAGFGEISARATAVVDKTRTDGGQDLVHLTVGAGAGSSHKGAPAKTGDGAVVSTAARVTPPAVDRPSVQIPSGAKPKTQSSATVAAPGTSCATGTWAFTDASGATIGTAKAVVQVWRGGSQIASQFASNAGTYNLCWSSGGTTNAVNMRFVHTNGAYKVVTNGGGDYAYVSGTVNVADGTTFNFGTLLPADTTQRRALHAYYDASLTYDWIYQNSGTNPSVGCWSPYGSSCRQLVVKWQSDNSGGAFWNTSGVTLAAGSPDSEDVPVHEYNHELMYDLYNSSFPATTNCSPHFLFSASSTTCAWTEGYADWAVTSVWGNTIYTYSPGVTDDFNRTWNGGATGDQVEGRVVQALDSLNDGVKYPFDNISGPGYRTAVNFWSVMRTFKPNTFAGFWSGRGALGQDVGQASLSALFQGTIDYGFRNPLADGVGKNQPQALVPHNYSATTTRGYWSAVAVRPADGSDSDVTLYNDAAQSSVLGSSAFSGTTTDFVAINSNSGARPLQTYYPRVTRFAGTGNYTVEFVQGFSTLSSGLTTVPTSSSQPISIRDSAQTAGVPVYYRAVPLSGQSLALTFLQPGGTIASRSAGVNSATGAAGQTVSLVTTPTATGFGGLVLTNQSLTNGSATIYADTTAPTGGSVVINGGAPRAVKPNVTLTIGSANDDQTGIESMQVSTDGTFDTEPVVPFSTLAKPRLEGANGNKTVYVRFMNHAGMWSAPVSDTIRLAVPPNIASISPSYGPEAGGTSVTVRGKFLADTSAVKVGTKAASFTVVSDILIRIVTPSGTGVEAVTITTPAGEVTSAGPDRFTYLGTPTITNITPSSGPTNTQVVVTGTGFTGATVVKFGTTDGTNLTVLSDTKLRVRAPAGVTGTVNIRVTAPGGVSAVVPADRYTYID